MAPPACDGVALSVGGVALKAYEAATADVIAIVRLIGPLGVPDIRFDCALVPPGATTRRRTSYDVPLPRPLMMMGLDADAGLRDAHDVPPSVEYWMLVAGAPPVPPTVKATDSWASPGVICVTTGAAGVEGVTSNVVGVDVAGSRLPLAATDAVIEQLPAATNVTAPVDEPTVHTPVVDDP